MSSNGPTSAEDWTIITDLLETIEQDPSAIEARRVLAQQYEVFGWNDAAAQQIRAILALSPGDKEASAWLIAYLHNGGDGDDSNNPKADEQQEPKKVVVEAKKGTLQELQTGYKDLMSNAKSLSLELQIFQELCGPNHDFAAQIADLKALGEGRLTSVVKVRPPPAARAVAAKIKTASTQPAREEIAFNDLEANARYLRNRSTESDADELRASVLKRCTAIKSSLPKDMTHIADTAFMHISHEVLQKKYQNAETMYGDPIPSIPRSNFLVTEDNYAWDMDELVAAIKANSGVMRNPLSTDLFSAEDVRQIVNHPLGRGLGALQLEQKELTKGVRQATMTRLADLAKILLDDMSDDAAPSRAAVEGFSLYIATLPTAEQEALDKLKVPAKDSHTGNVFDTTVGDAVADAKANRQCFHKTADFLGQAARWLRENGGEGKVPGAWK